MKSESHTMALLELNVDVLSLITSYLSSDDARALSLTARGIHGIAQRQALSSVVIQNCTQLEGFAAYILRDVHRGALCLRRLELALSATELRGSKQTPISPAVTLANLLQETHNLRYLRLPSAELLLDLEPRIGNALLGLPALEELYIASAGRQTMRVLGSLRCRVRKLFLECEELPPPWEPRGPALTLTGLRHLEWIKISYLSMDSFTGEGSQRQVWPAVRHLELYDCTVSMAPFVRAFPNVHTLQLDYLNPLDEDDQTGMLNSPAICWQQLDHVLATWPTDLSCWKLTCPVRRLSLPHLWSIDDANEASMFAAVVRNTTPLILSFSVHLALLELWPPLVDAVPRLRCLKLTLRDKTVAGVKPSLATFMEHIPPIWGSWTILLLRLYIIAPLLKAAGESDDKVLLSFANLIADAVPSLRCLAMGFGTGIRCDYDDFSSPRRTFQGKVIWWRVVDENGRRMLKAIPEQTGLRVMAYIQSAEFESSLTFNDYLFDIQSPA